ncbi:FAD:protein FMN transferase [Streptomyces lushanensis]|uniref:FAD:protein FMN transferase n=1 Tax=Streptomyces lushanensis TaxID=1434255 RepID=UPI00099F4B9F|nr:FAD:protein FMN transferase [Streptomyces lushanensis]
MGTVFSFDIRDPRTPAIEAALAEAVAWLHHVDEVYSTYRPDSVVCRLARGDLAPHQCSAEVREVLALCKSAVRASAGWFSHLVGGVLDPSALVKGWSVERASQILHESGARHTCVDGGGDLRLRGEAAPGVPWRVGVAHPLRADELCAVVTGRDDLAVATSGTAELGARIIDPHRGTPAECYASLTVVGTHLAMSDAYSTAAFAMGPTARDWLESLDGYEGFAVTPDGRTWHTTGFPGETPRAGGHGDVRRDVRVTTRRR